MRENYQILIIGNGSWGKALGYLLGQNNYRYQIWSRSSSQQLESVVIDADIIISAISIVGVRHLSDQLRSLPLKKNALIITTTKGLDLETMQTPMMIWQQALPKQAIIVLCGPNLSKEIKAGLPAATVVASTNHQAAETAQTIFSSEQFRVYINHDPLGTELGGTLKNIMAIASGVCDGLKLGTNAKAALLTRALPEIIRVGKHLGASVETFWGLSGLGDLLATCDSPLSRNYQVGFRLAQGESIVDILDNLEGTAEGVNTVNVLIKLARQEKISVPITSQVYLLLKGQITPSEAVKNLINRELKDECY